MSYTQLPTHRFYDAKERKERCRQKDSIIKPILRSISIQYPKYFWAIIMPCSRSPEFKILREAGVPSKNIFAVEREVPIWRHIKDDLHLEAGHIPMDANTRMDYIQAEHPEGFDLIYLDFYGQLQKDDMEMFEKIMAFKMLKPGSRLIVNYAKGRATSQDAKFNHMVSKAFGREISTQPLLESAMKMHGHQAPLFMKDHVYKSLVGHTRLTYVTTEARFK